MVCTAQEWATALFRLEQNNCLKTYVVKTTYVHTLLCSNFYSVLAARDFTTGVFCCKTCT
jgi:hypothetical protein